MRRPEDAARFTLEAVQGDGGGDDFSIVIDRPTCYDLELSLTSPSCSRFEIGDDATFNSIGTVLDVGRRYEVTVNGRRRMTGRLLKRNLPVTIDGGATMQLAIRTRLADAAFTVVRPDIGVRNTDLHDLILAAFPLLVEDDFIFAANVYGDLLSGRGGGSPPPKDLKKMAIEEARPHPGETQWAFVDRHLSRFGLVMWDAPDGRIIVGAPDDQQEALYIMACLKGEGSDFNNVLDAQRSEDYENIPLALTVFGQGGSRDTALATVEAAVADETLSVAFPLLDRFAIVLDESIRTQAQAERRAAREMFQRRFGSLGWELMTDGLAYWDGEQETEYDLGRVADVRVSVGNILSGPYMIHRIVYSGSAEQGHTTRLSTIPQGVWAL